jgi:tetratricopeptide (TPR) repeat protein
LRRDVPLPPATLQLQLWDEAGNHLVASGSDLTNAAGNAAGNLLGQEPRYPSTSGQHFLVRILALLARGRPFDGWSRDAYEQRGRLLRYLLAELPPASIANKQQLALRELRKAIELGGQSATLWGDYGAVLHNGALTVDDSNKANDHLKEAIAAYSKGLEQAPKDIELLVNRGWAHERLQLHDQAKNDFAKAVEVKPDHAEAHSGLGYALAYGKNDAETFRAAHQALMHRGGDYLILHNVASIYAKLADSNPENARSYRDLAMDLLRRAVELWKRGGAGPDEIQQIVNDPALRGLRDRADYVNLVRSEGP